MNLSMLFKYDNIFDIGICYLMTVTIKYKCKEREVIYMKKICVISTSYRKQGNSDLLADEFIKGALEKGHEVEKIYLSNQTINFCRGCLHCQTSGTCIIKDDISEILEKMKTSDVLVFATPIYFYEMSGQMKTLLDRSNPLYASDYQFRDIYLIATAADDDITCMNRCIEGLNGWITCFEHAQLKGVMKGVDVDGFGEVKSKTELLSLAYNMGKQV